MKKIKTFMFSLHRIVGTIVCLFLLMWFISGLVLIYHPFPDVSTSQKNEHMNVLPDSLPNIESIVSRLSISEKKIKSITAKNIQDQVLFYVQTSDSLYTISEKNDELIKPITKESIYNIAQQWIDAPILKIDTLYERDIWIMYSRYEKEMSIYKIYFDDDLKHQLYLSSKTGDVQQFTNKNERFWAWVGSIPHKFYIPALRKNTDVWIWSLTVGGVVVVISALSGLFYGGYILIKRYQKRRKIGSPYKTFWLKWHYVFGLLFGVFIITFGFSGAMALQKIPQWAVKTHGDYRVSDSKLRGKSLPTNKYILDYRKLKEKFPNIKYVKWSHFNNIPVYNVVSGNQDFFIDASASEVKELYLSPSDIKMAIEKLYGDTSFSISFIDKYEEYYLSRTNELPLPVYKVEVDNEDRACFYINPQNGEFKFVNQANRAKKWVFGALHYLNIKYLIERPLLWTVLIWTLCIGGSIVSLSGVYLAFRYVRRKIKQVKNIFKNK